jgi:hypothetical protein
LVNKKVHSFILLSLLLANNALAQAPLDLELEDPEDMQLLLEEFPEEKKAAADDEASEEESQDDLATLKEDLGDVEFAIPEDDELVKQVDELSGKKSKEGSRPSILGINGKSSDSKMIFDVGKEEKELLEIAKNMQGKIPESEWNEIAGATTSSSYTVVRGDWLWKISQKLFGSGFYYSKIWSLNPYITNPHEIEPGMILTFTTGSGDGLPEVSVGGDAATENVSKIDGMKSDEYDKWGDSAKPDWISEKEKLQSYGVYIQYASIETDEDLKEISEQSLIREYEAYEPPRPDFEIEIPAEEYDQVGFDKNAKITYNFKEGFYLNTFVSSNIVQDFGKVESAIQSKTLFTQYDTIYVRFDENIDVVAGDKFSIYSAAGEVSHENSDRTGFKYTIVASIQTKQKHGSLWECDIIESSGVLQRSDRVTVYTPKIERITKTFNSRLIESVLMGAFEGLREFASFGDVIYLDRGRADGVEMGNVFEVYGFKDHATQKNITDNPTYKNGEVTIISLTDNFATGLVTQSIRDFEIGDIAITKTKEAAARAMKIKARLEKGEHTRLEDQALEELDVELNLDDLNEALLDKADRIQFTEDELAELERQEREKSIMSEGERDLRSLERLEQEIETAEAMLKEARLDEDKLLEGSSLDKLEENLLYQQQESLDEIEENFGKRYLDEDLNDKDNPFGLTEFDIEEIDELLNVEKELQDQE